MTEVDEQMIFEMGYNAGFKNGIKGSIPRAQIDEMIKNIKNESFVDMYDGQFVSLNDVLHVISKYIGEENNDL